MLVTREKHKHCDEWVHLLATVSILDRDGSLRLLITPLKVVELSLIAHHRREEGSIEPS
jgi:hypothetical protein